MSTQMTTQQTFEDNILNRLREDIGKLLPDEVLAEMVKKAMDKMFFEKRRVPRYPGNSYNHDTIEVPNWFETYVEEALRDRANKLAEKWMQDNAETLSKLFTTVFGAIMPKIIADSIFRPIENRINEGDVNVHNTIMAFMREKLQIPT